MKIAIVILNWNGSGLLRQFLPSLLAFSEGADVVVADNASTDDSIAVLEAEFPSVRIIRNATNLGFAGGYNEALRQVDADIFALVNSDVEVTPGWLSPIRVAFADVGLAIVQPKIRAFRDKDHFEYAGASGGFIDRFGYPFCRGRVFETLEKDSGQYDVPTDIFWASGACCFIRAEVFRELQGFDASFFAHQEEIDLCWRAFNKGFKARCIPQSVVYHVGGATLDEGSPFKSYLNFRNSLSMLAKNLPKGKLFPIIFLRLCLDVIAGIRFLLQGKPRHCWAVARAHFAFYARLGANLKSRQNPQRQEYYAVKNLIFSYFVRGKKIFSELI